MGYIENASLILSALIPYPGFQRDMDSGIFGRSTAAVAELVAFHRVSFPAFGMGADTLDLGIFVTRREHHANRSSATSVFQWVR